MRTKSTSPSGTPARLALALGMAALLGACGGGGDYIRPGPQDIHPSPSALAQGAYIAVDDGRIITPSATACGTYGSPCHSAAANDGSTPIID